MNTYSEKPPFPVVTFLDSPDWQDYALLDSGNGQTLERFGPYRLIRSEPQAAWQPTLPEADWNNADAWLKPESAEYGGEWVFNHKIPATFHLSYKNLNFQVALARSRHLGVFPEQAAHWDWITGKIQAAKRPVKVLNLFGYTGLATLAAAQAGAAVTHVDASKHAITWANHNASLSGLTDHAIRWILDDALKFAERESRRNSFYDGIILDPPKFGRGPKGQVWKYFDNILALISACRNALSDKPLFIVLTSYAIQASSIITWQIMQEMAKGLGGNISMGELITREESGGHMLSHALYARWSND